MDAAGGKPFVATVTVKATVGADGVVRDAVVQSSTAKNTAVDKCVEDAFKRLDVSVLRPKQGDGIVITVPVQLQPAPQPKR